jgi:negative regulator of sigma E activity
MKTTALDREIKKRVQALESDIPPRLERQFLESLQRSTPLPARPKPRLRLLYGAAAAAAACAAVVFICLFFFGQRTDTPSEPTQVVVLAPRVEGQAAEAYIFREKAPDMTIIWVEKRETGGAS